MCGATGTYKRAPEKPNLASLPLCSVTTDPTTDDERARKRGQCPPPPFPSSLLPPHVADVLPVHWSAASNRRNRQSRVLTDCARVIVAVVLQSDNQFQTMSLGTQGVCTIGNMVTETRRADMSIVSRTNAVDDIDGSRPWIKANSYLSNRPDLHQNADVRGAASRRLHPENPHKQIGLNLTNDDIDGSKPAPNVFKTNRRNDPLNPDYKLPSGPAPPPVHDMFQSCPLSCCASNNSFVGGSAVHSRDQPAQ
jgi:hypothetical protein